VNVSSSSLSANGKAPSRIASASGVEAVQSTALVNGGIVGKVPSAWLKCRRFRQISAWRISTGSVNRDQEVQSLQFGVVKSPFDGTSTVVTPRCCRERSLLECDIDTICLKINIYPVTTQSLLANPTKARGDGSFH
jgi:phage protein D